MNDDAVYVINALVDGAAESKDATGLVGAVGTDAGVVMELLVRLLILLPTELVALTVNE